VNVLYTTNFTPFSPATADCAGMSATTVSGLTWSPRTQILSVRCLSLISPHLRCCVHEGCMPQGRKGACINMCNIYLIQVYLLFVTNCGWLLNVKIYFKQHI
jgi:hypothetical protein